MSIAITGSTGLLGSALIDALQTDGQLISPVVRRKSAGSANEILWDPIRGSIEGEKFNNIDAVVHLAGESVAQRWTAARKKEILESRVRGTTLLCQTISSLSSKPSVLVSASAIGYYGDRGDERIDEASSPGDGFLADVCQQWEAATQSARDADIRVVNLRIGVVLTPKGGALAKMLTPFRLGVGGVLGSGRQYMSWIALDDLVRIIQFALHAAAISGPVNAVAPNPATNREFTKTLGRVLRRPTIFPLPAFAAHLIFGQMADEVLLAGAHVVPNALSAAQFEFAYPQLEPALRHLLNSGESRTES
jgi:uncharacterized protein (TIGR01777 family)